MQLNSFIDHTVLKPTARPDDVRKLCEEAVRYDFASVCVNPFFVPLAAELLEGKKPAVCTVIGFPLGANTSRVKVFEAEKAVEDGAVEIDMVINISAALEHDYDFVQDEIAAVVKAVKDKALVKVIIETCYLSDEEITEVSRCCINAGAAFVKTSTGFGSGGAKVEHLRIMKKAVGEDALLKASGGIRSRDDAMAMIEAGASRLGTSSGIVIVSQ